MYQCITAVKYVLKIVHLSRSENCDVFLQLNSQAAVSEPTSKLASQSFRLFVLFRKWSENGYPIPWLRRVFSCAHIVIRRNYRYKKNKSIHFCLRLTSQPAAGQLTSTLASQSLRLYCCCVGRASLVTLYRRSGVSISSGAPSVARTFKNVLICHMLQQQR